MTPSKTIIGWRELFLQIINSSFRSVLFNLFYKRIQDKAKPNKTLQPSSEYIKLGL